MAYWVANHLHMRPNDIIYGWGVAELIVTFGHYRNALAKQQYDEWQRRSIDQKRGQKIPPEYDVLFYSPEQLQEED